MPHVSTTAVAATHQIYAALLCLAGRAPTPDGAVDHARDPAVLGRDRGAVSLEQVLWFVAAGVSVAVIAAILWGQIRDTADDPITPPEAP